MPSHQPAARRGPNIVLLAIAGVVLLGIIAVLATRGGNDSDKTAAEASETRPVTVSGDALPAFVNPDADAAVGLQAPVLGGETFDGKKITIGDSGKSTLVVFVAHWCPHCQREVPFLKSYFDLHGLPEGVDVLAVSTSINADRPNYPPSKWLDREGWEIPTMVDADDSGAAAAWGLSAFPYFVALRADGTVAARVTGELEAPQLEALFAAAKG